MWKKREKSKEGVNKKRTPPSKRERRVKDKNYSIKDIE